MSHLINDDALFHDMANALTALRRWLMELGEQHEGLDASAIDDLLRRYRREVERA